MDISDVKLKINLDDMLSRSEFEWQEFVVEQPMLAVETIMVLFEYVRTMEGLDEWMP